MLVIEIMISDLLEKLHDFRKLPVLNYSISLGP